MHRAPKESLDHPPRLVLRSAFYLTLNAIAGIVDDDIQASEVFLSLCECVHDLLLVRHVKRNDEELRCRVSLGEIAESLGTASCCHCALAGLEDLFEKRSTYSL